MPLFATPIARLVRMICFFAVLGCFTQNVLAQQRAQDLFILALDPGHGGKDPGAISNGGKEKEVNLAVALKVERLIKTRYPNVKVVMTRRDDRFIGLMERTKIANRNKADLFISIHANSAKSRTARGSETYVLGLWRMEDNLQVAMRENESILLEKDYEVTYQGFDPNSSESYIIFELLQNRHLDQSISAAQKIQTQLAELPIPDRGVRQDAFLVIRETAMPSILVELGFLSNKNDARFLLSTRGQNKLAEAITAGFGQYFEAHIRAKNGDNAAIEMTRRSEQVAKQQQEEALETEEEIETVPDDMSSIEEESQEEMTEATSNQKKSALKYHIQISASKRKLSTRDPWFRKLPVKVTKEKKLYIYTVESSSSLKEARRLLKKHKKYFPDAFIVVYRDGKRVENIYK